MIFPQASVQQEYIADGAEPKSETDPSQSRDRVKLSRCCYKADPEWEERHNYMKDHKQVKEQEQEQEQRLDPATAPRPSEKGRSRDCEKEDTHQGTQPPRQEDQITRGRNKTHVKRLSLLPRGKTHTKKKCPSKETIWSTPQNTDKKFPMKTKYLASKQL